MSNWLSTGAGAGLTLGYLDDEARVDNPDPNLGDGKLKYDDTDFAVQGNFGVMIEPSDRTRIGLRYLTETELDFKSDDLLLGGGLSFLWLGDLKVTPAGGGVSGQVSGEYENVNITFLSSTSNGKRVSALRER